MTVAALTSYLDLGTKVVTILGFPLAIYLFYADKKKERRDREYGTYNALDDKYVEFLQLCLNYPDLDIFDVPVEEGRASTPAQRRQEQILFTILISILERAFLMYKDQSTNLKRRQWTGWSEYMKDYCSRENFRREWPTLGPQFDSSFVEFIDKLIQTVPPRETATAATASGA